MSEDLTNKKHTSGKVNFLTLDFLSLALYEVAKVFDMGRIKHGLVQFSELKDVQSIYTNACWRHKLKRCKEDKDEEIGCYHIAHQIATLMIMLQDKLETEYGDNYPYDWTPQQQEKLKAMVKPKQKAEWMVKANDKKD